MNLYLVLFNRYVTAPILVSLLIVPFETIQAEETLVRIQIPFNYRTSKPFIQNIEPGLFFGATLPAISYWLLNKQIENSAEPPSEAMRGNASYRSKTLNQSLGVIPKKTKSDLIITTYFSQLCHQDPWDVDINTRNQLMGLPACMPRQNYSVLPLRIARQRRLHKYQSTTN